MYYDCTTMKLYFLAHARMPSEKAHGIQIAYMCEAFLACGATVELVVPSRGQGNMRDFYGLSRQVRVRRLPVVDLQYFGPVGYWLTALQFIAGYLGYLFGKVLRGERFVIYTVDMDNFSFAPLALVPRPVVAEMHNIKKPSPWLRWFFKKAQVVATNELIAAGLAETFLLPAERLLVEPNGVDPAALAAMTK